MSDPGFMKYDIVIVLCPSKKDNQGKFSEFQDGLYLGGETRMNAVLEIHKRSPNAEFIVVGGYDEGKETSKKVQDMEDFLKENLVENVRGIKSLPCTFHNFIAVFNTLNAEEIKSKKIGLLTNYYHLPRAFRFLVKAKEDLGLKIIPSFYPISAESVVKDFPEQNMYNRENEFLLRVESERKGLRDLEDEIYSDSCLNETRKEQFIAVAKKFSNILLTPNEKEKINSKE